MNLVETTRYAKRAALTTDPPLRPLVPEFDGEPNLKAYPVFFATLMTRLYGALKEAA